MAITKRTFLDQITVLPENGTVLWRLTTVIEEDGVELTRSYHRRSAALDETVPDLPAEVAPHRALVDNATTRQRVKDDNDKQKGRKA
jgi:hypothetical protein